MNLTLAINPPVLRRRRRADIVAARVSAAGPAPERFNRYLLNVDFATDGGDEWSAIGGGETVAAAIAAARIALPAGPQWDVLRWNDLYGD